MSTSEIVVSPALLREYRDTPLELFKENKISREQLQALLAGIASVVSSAIQAAPRSKINICRDPKDNMLLECCVAASADYLVTGDKDLLEIGKGLLSKVAPGLKIVTPKSFVTR